MRHGGKILDTNALDTNQITVILGDEYDSALQDRLMDTLRQMGAIPIAPVSRYLAGSQDLQIFEVMLDGKLLRVESETYIGLSLCGPSDLVAKVRKHCEKSLR